MGAGDQNPSPRDRTSHLLIPGIVFLLIIFLTGAGGGVHMPQHARGVQGTTCRSHFSFCHVGAGAGTRVSGLAASTFTPSAILPALFSFGGELMDGGEVLRNLWHVLRFFFL